MNKDESDFSVDSSLVREIYVCENTWDFSKFSGGRKERLTELLESGALSFIANADKNFERLKNIYKFKGQ